jgi:hypothetical protein
MSGGNKRYSMHCSRKASCKKLQKGLDLCLEQTVTAPVPEQRQRLFRDSSPAGYSACCGALVATARDALHYRLKDPDNTEQDYRYPLDAKAGLYPWAE